mgnify:CR=1 FL=1
MNKNNYISHPIDTKDVGLPKKLNALAKEIAKDVEQHAHEVWSDSHKGWLDVWRRTK